MEKEHKQLLLETYSAFLDSEYAEDAIAVGTEDQNHANDQVQSSGGQKGDGYNIKQALNLFHSLFEEVQSNQAALETQIKRNQRERDQLAQERLRPLFLELLDLRENLEGGLIAAKSYRLFRLRLWFRKPETRLIRGLRDGQEMTLNRLDKMLAAYQIRPIETVGEKFEPYTMRVVDTVKQEYVADGIVTEELGKGFFWGDDVLRVADVIVNKLRSDPEIT